MSASKVVSVKVTACGEGAFTCNDGQCVHIEERCNQISNCRSQYHIVIKNSRRMFSRDESDEDNCKMLVMKDNYNNKIAPFGFDYVNNIVIPVQIDISISIMDILSIQEVNLVYVVKFRLLMEWYDYRSVTRMNF